MTQSYGKFLDGFLNLPKFEEMRNILCVQPHPDDADISIGGTIAQLTEKGVKVTYVTVTDGGAGTLDEIALGSKLAEIRKSEQEKAAKILGISELVWLEYEDLGDYKIDELMKKLVQIIRARKPDMIMTVDPFLPYEVHPDHIKCGMATAQATFFYRLPKVLPGTCDETVKLIGFFNTAKPNTFVELSERHFQRKMQALACHRSQFDESALRMLAGYFAKRSSLYGRDSVVETLKILPPMALHVFPETVEM